MSMLNANPAAELMPEIHYDATGKPVPPWPSPVALRKLPRPVQERILAASAELSAAVGMEALKDVFAQMGGEGTRGVVRLAVDRARTAPAGPSGQDRPPPEHTLAAFLSCS